MKKIIVLICFMFTGCAFMNDAAEIIIDNPIDNTPVCDGTTVDVHLNGNVCMPMIDGTYQWLPDFRQDEHPDIKPEPRHDEHPDIKPEPRHDEHPDIKPEPRHDEHPIIPDKKPEWSKDKQ
jgi:hypothetical protein